MDHQGKGQILPVDHDFVSVTPDVRGRRMTFWPSLRTELRNAGAKWDDQEVVRDGMLVTSRKPADLPAFCREMLEMFPASPQQLLA
jgi:protease I